MKKLLSVILLICMIFMCYIPSYANKVIKSSAETDVEPNFKPSKKAFSVYLCEASTGKVLYSDNEFAAASPASVTKIMTLLLVMEALDSGKFSLDDKVSVSAKAASMGGSQVFLEEGERITVEELIKSTVIASGNDASVALAELTAGSESAFVRLMNSKASELGLKNSCFENTTGLDDTTINHYTCAADIAKMSRELIKHDIILKYSSLWQDTIRNGEFTLTNTNRLVRYYDGCNGLKTGSTDKAGYCISACAKRGNMQLIAVVMGAESRDDRNAIARELLDYGFANYALYERGEVFIENASVLGGVKDFVALYSSPFCEVVSKSDFSNIELTYDIPENVSAPFERGDIVGRIVYKIGDAQIGESSIFVLESIEKIGFWDMLLRILKRIIVG